MAAFFASHPETVRAIKIIQSHHAVVGFRQQHFQRSQCVPFHQRRRRRRRRFDGRWCRCMPFEPADPAQSAKPDKNYLFDDLIAQHSSASPLQWHLILTVGQPGDPTDDATIPWPEERQQVDVGTLTLDQVESDETAWTVATSTSIRWCCRSALHRPMIPCSALDRRFIRNRLQDEPARRRSRARSRLRTYKSERQDDDRTRSNSRFRCGFFTG